MMEDTGWLCPLTSILFRPRRADSFPPEQPVWWRP
jgi:hypothetical protein